MSPRYVGACDYAKCSRRPGGNGLNAPLALLGVESLARRCPSLLRDENQVADLAHGTGAASRCRHVIGTGQYRRMGIRYGERQAGALEQRYVGQVVADMRHVRGIHAALPRKRRKGRGFVVASGEQVRHAQFAG